MSNERNIKITPDDVGVRIVIEEDPNEGVMERNGVKQNNGRVRNRVKRSGATS